MYASDTMSCAMRGVCVWHCLPDCLPAWLQDDSLLLTASGDQHVGVWDTEVGQLKLYCAGHDGSVKVVTPHSSSHDVFASGANTSFLLPACACTHLQQRRGV